MRREFALKFFIRFQFNAVPYIYYLECGNK